MRYCDNNFGDYPHYAPAEPGKKGEFTGWMLLSYKKPVKASSYAEGSTPRGARIHGIEPSQDLPPISFRPTLTDEACKTFWMARTNGDTEWVEIDLELSATVYAVQVNYHDHQSNTVWTYFRLRHRYEVEGSLDGQDWVILVDRRNNYKDVPNDYVQVDNPTRVRYVRYKRYYEVPTPHLAISDLRVFGIGEGKKPATVKNFKVVRQADRRDAMITWDAAKNSQGYNIRWGIAPDKLYNSWLLYGKNELLLKSLSTDQPYYFTIEAFNENGVSEATKIQEAQ